MQVALFFRVTIAALAAFASVQMIRIVYRILRQGRIDRRPGLGPLSMHNKPLFYWSIVGFIALGAVGTIWGTVVLILRL